MLEEAPDTACDVALEAASNLAVGLALGTPSVSILAGCWIVAGAGKRDDVERAVELPVAAAIESVTVLALAYVAGSGATPASRANAASLRQRPGCDQAM